MTTSATNCAAAHYEPVAGDWQHRTKKSFADAIRAATRLGATIGALRSQGFIGSGPRSPTPGAPYTFVTTPAFLSQFGFETSRHLPDIEALEDAGLLSKEKLLAGDIPAVLDDDDDDDDGDLDEFDGGKGD